MTALVLWRNVGAPFTVHSMIVGLSVLAAMELPERAPAGFVNPMLESTVPFIDKLIKWDAHWYTYTAQYGYDKQNIVFFPVLIVLLRLCGELGLHVGVCGFVLCNLFAFASFHYLYLVFRQDFCERIARRAVWMYAVMPTSFFLNTIYTEPLFLAFSLAALYYLRKNQWRTAGFAAALAAVTRNIGIFLIVVIICEAITRRNHGREVDQWRWAFLLPPAALAGFMVYNYWHIGSAVAFVEGQHAWGRQFEYPWVNVWNDVLLIKEHFPQIEPGIVFDLFLVLLCLAAMLLLTGSNRFRIRRSHLLLGWIWFVVPLLSTSPWFPLYSMARFVLVIFPLYVFLAQLPNLLYRICLAGGAITLSYCTIAFASWRWIG